VQAEFGSNSETASGKRSETTLQKVEFSPMAYRLAMQQMQPQRSAEDLRRAFETAVCEIHRADLAAKAQYRAPIVSRARLLGLSQAGAEKRALSDAANALAQLWKL
jgi:hypothetical protein